MLVFNQKLVSGSRKIKSTIEGLAFDTPVLGDNARSIAYAIRMQVSKKYYFKEISRVESTPLCEFFPSCGI